MKEWIKRFCADVVENWPNHATMYEAQMFIDSVYHATGHQSEEIQNEETNHLNKEK